MCGNRSGLSQYLERELGELLVRTEIPADFSADDIRWRWPEMRIVLPKGIDQRRERGKTTKHDVRGRGTF
jgi:hypothetical protein